MVAQVTIVRALEYGRVPLPDRWNTAATRERLEQAALRAGFRAFEIRGRQIHALGVVGVVDLGGIIVEVLPKTHDACAPQDAAIFLSELLRFGGILDHMAVIEARTATGERTLLEIILAWATREAATNLRDGLPRRYEAREEVSTAVRGRIELRHLARRLPGKDFELVVRHAPLSENNPLSRILKWLVGQIASRTRLIATRRRCQSLLQGLEHVGVVQPMLSDIDRIVLQATELRWRPLLDLAQLLLRQASPDPSRAGAHDAVAVLFRLHDLFERVLRRVFREGLTAHGVVLRRADRRLLHAAGAGVESLMPLTPDFLFGRMDRSGAVLLGDAKWKRILDSGAGLALAESDAYQLTAYLAAWAVPAGFVFCPLGASPGPGQLATANYRITGLGANLHVTGVHLPTLVAATPEGAATRAALCERVCSVASDLQAAA